MVQTPSSGADRSICLPSDGVVFVAGGAGMAGTAVVEALLERRPLGRVRASCRTLTPTVIDPRVEHVAVNLADADAVTAALRGCHAAVFAAAEGGGIQMLSQEPWRQV